jgi:hypothetical protein
MMLAFVEKQTPHRKRTRGGARVKEGQARIAALFKNYGAILGALGALGVEVEEHTPQAWRRAWGLRPARGETDDERYEDAKRVSVMAAQAKWPDVDLRKSPRARVPHAGKAESMLLCWLAWRRLEKRLEKRRGER